MILETRRLRLRPFESGDVQRFAEYRSDPEVARYQGWEAPYTVEQAAEFISNMQRGHPGIPGQWYQFAIERTDVPGLIGDCALYVFAHDPSQGEIGFTIARAHQGAGYGVEAIARLLEYAFDELALHRITAACDTENSASARLLSRVGLRREGTLIENNWSKGEWGSEYVYAILSREWRDRR